jgi:hypothetical protein
VNRILSHINELETRIAEYKSKIDIQMEASKKDTSLTASASAAKLQEHESNYNSLSVQREQALFDLGQANERAAIAASATNNRQNLRSAFDVTHSSRAITTPIFGLQAARNERTGVPIRMMDSLPGPQDPNDAINPVAHGTSSLRSYQFVPFYRTPSGSASLTQAGNATLSASADGSLNARSSMTPQGYLDPNPQTEQANQTAASNASTDPVHSLDLGFQVRPGMIYNSGFNEKRGVYSPADIILNHSADAHNKGQLTYISPKDIEKVQIPFRGQFGYNISDTGNGSAGAQIDLLSTNSQTIDVRTASFRYLNTYEELGASFGTMETVFGDLGTAAQSIATGALMVGTVSTTGEANNFKGVPQLRLTRYWYGVLERDDISEFSMSLEDVSSNLSKYNYLPGQKDLIQPLNRYPAVVSRLRYGGANQFDSIQIAGLLIPIGFDSKNPANNFHESFDTALGVSTNARLELGNNCRRDTVYLGAVAGRGIGNYIFGNLPSVVLTSKKDPVQDDIHLVDTFGAYASYRRILSNSSSGFWSSNTMFGVAEASHSLPSTDSLPINRQLYQAGVNLLWNNAANTSAFGVEYQYGSRLVEGGLTNSDTLGENHRIGFVLQLSAIPASLTPVASGSLTSRSSAVRSATANDFATALGDRRSSNKSKMRY